ncbi:MAG: Rep protein [CRESS virus sp. ct1Gc25]|nr:MAG: Rep protein [CRESS virus sp. ct1Gc25]
MDLNTGAASGSRGWCLTWNNYTNEEYEYCRVMWSKNNVVYAIVGKEVGSCGTPHLQCYVYYRTKRSFRVMKQEFYKCHIECAIADALKNEKYCNKDGKHWEFGTRPLTQKEKGDAEKNRWDLAKMLAKEDRLDEIDSKIYITNLRNLERIRDKHKRKAVALDGDLLHEWVYGETGVGKSTYARSMYPDAYIKNRNKWWDGYCGEEVVLIEEWSPDMKMLIPFLKDWCDRWPFFAESKGGHIGIIRPVKIIVTSNYCIDECVNLGDSAPLHRKFKEYRMNKDGTVDLNPGDEFRDVPVVDVYDPYKIPAHDVLGDSLYSAAGY